MLIILYSI